MHENGNRSGLNLHHLSASVGPFDCRNVGNVHEYLVGAVPMSNTLVPRARASRASLFSEKIPEPRQFDDVVRR